MTRPGGGRGGRLRRLRRPLAWAAGLLLVAELGLQLARPAVLDAVRHRTFQVESYDADFITLQSINFDPQSGRPLLLYDPGCFWRMAPLARGTFFLTEDVATNALGLRGPPLEPRAAEGEVRLLFLGDSVTFGFGVAEAERYSDRLAAALSAADPARRWTAVNAGVVGYGSLQAELRLPEWIEAVRPDVVCVCVGINDCLLAGGPDREFLRLATSWPERLRGGLRSSQVYAAAEAGLAWLTREVHEWRTGEWRAVVRWLDYPAFPAQAAKVPRATEAEVLDSLARIDALCRGAGIPLVLVTQFSSAQVPSQGTLDPDYFGRLERLSAAIVGWAGERGIPLADARRALQASGRPPAALLSDFCHPTPQGHALIASELARTLEATGLIVVGGGGRVPGR